MVKGSTLVSSERTGREKTGYFIIYTLLFAFVAVLVNIVFIRDGVTYVRSVDGFVQHSVALEYYGQWLRDIFRELFVSHRLEIRNFDFSIGMGSDVVTSLNYYAIGDPLNLLSVFVPREYTGYLYTALTILRYYLAGAAFSLYCFERKIKNSAGILAGALLYAFSVFSVVAGTMHPFFINPMIYMPLLFLGTEKILKKGNPLCLVLTVMIAEVSNFYFFYMLVIATVVYVFLRLFTIYGLKIRNMVAPLFRIAVSSVIGVMLGAVIFYPIVLAFLSDGRVTVEHTYPLLYGVRYYLDLFTSFVYYNGFEPWTLVGSGVLFLFALAALFSLKKKNTALKAAVVICVAGLCIPAFGGFTNGFSYENNRWCFVFTFVIAYASALMWEDILFSENKLRAAAIALAPALYAGCCVFVPYTLRDKLKFALLFVAASTAIILVSAILPKGKKVKKLIEASVIAVNICCIAVNSFFVYNDAAANHYSNNSVSSYISAEAAAIKKQTELTGETDFFRYTSNKLEFNDTVRNGGFATQYYWSLSDRNISDFQDSVYLNEGFYQHYNGFDDIAVFNTLSSVKYYYDKTNKEGAVPFGFAKTGVENLYVNSFALPLVYAYDSYATKAYFDSLSSSPEKQQLLLESVVLEEAPSGIAKEENKASVSKLDFEITSDSDFVTLDGNTFTVTKNNSTVTFKIKNILPGEAYLSLRDISYRPTTPMELYGSDTACDPLNLFGEAELQQMGIPSLTELSKKQWQAPEYLDFITTASDGNGVNEKRKLKFYTPNYRFYAGKKDCDLYLGYSDSGFTSVVLSFPKTGVYTFGEISLLSQDMSFYNEGIRELTSGMTAETKVETDKITAKVDLEEGRLLCFAIPYSEGWSVYVDGQKQTLLKANIMHMAVEVAEGEHEIELKYSPVRMYKGAIISLAGLILLFAWELWYYITRRKNKSL